MAAIRCEESDRIPIVVRGVDPLHNLAGLPSSDHPSFKPLIKVVGEKTEWVYRWHPPEEDILANAIGAKIHVESVPSKHEGFNECITTFYTPLGPLSTIEFVSVEGKPGMTKKYLIESPDDLVKFLSLPYEFKKPNTDLFFKLKKQMGDNGVIMASIGLDPIGHVLKLMGIETLAIWSKTERESIICLLDEIYRRCNLLLRSLLDDDVGPVFCTLGMEKVTPPWFSGKDFNEFVTQYDQNLWAPIKEREFVLHVHCHGRLKMVLDDFISMGVDCLHPVEAPPYGDLELSEAKQKLKGIICIEGNIQLDDLYRQDEEFIREEVKTVIMNGAPGGGFILCPTASPIPPRLEEKILRNYLAFIDAGLEYGKLS